MKALITLLFITCSMVAFGQKKDSVTVKPNALQMEQLQQMEKQLQELNEQYQKAIELIVGVKREDIEKIDFKDGDFHVKLKKQPK